MKIYLLFLAIFATCRTDQVSRSAQPDPYSDLTSNDLDRETYLDGQDYRRNIERVGDDRLNYGRRAGLGQPVYVGRTRGLDDDSYRYPMGLTRSAQNYDRNLPIGTSQNDGLRAGRPYEENRKEDPALRRYDYSLDRNTNIPKDDEVGNEPKVVWNRAAFNDKNKEPLITRSAKRDREVSPSGLEGTGPGQGADAGINAPISRSGNYDQGAYINRNYENNQGSRTGSTNYLERSAPIGRAGTYDQENDGNRVIINGQRYNSNDHNLRTDDISQEAKDASTRVLDEKTAIERTENINQEINKADSLNSEDDTDRSDSLAREDSIGRHGYSHPDPEVEYNLRASHIPLFPEDNDRTVNDEYGYNNNNFGYANNDNIVPDIISDEMIAEIYNDQMVPDIYSNDNDVILISKSGFNNILNSIKDGNYAQDVALSDSKNGLLEPIDSYGSIDYNSLDPNYFESYTNNYVPSTSNNKIADKPITATYNDTTGNKILNDSRNVKFGGAKKIVDRFADTDVAHRGFHNVPIMFDDANIVDDNLNVIDINGNNAVKGYNGGECQCSNRNGHRICTCDYHKCEGTSCKRVTQTAQSQSQSHLQSHSQSHSQSQTQSHSTCEYCKTLEAQYQHSGICESCKAKEIVKEVANNYCESCKAKEIVQETHHHCESCKAKEIVQEIHKHEMLQETHKHDMVQEAHNHCESCKAREIVKETHNHCEHCKVKETYNEYEHEHSNTKEHKQSSSCESKRSCCNGGCGCNKCCKCCKCGCGCGCCSGCGCGCCSGCGCGHSCGCSSSSSCKHKTSSSNCHDHSYESGELNNFISTGNNQHNGGGEMETGRQKEYSTTDSGVWSGSHGGGSHSNSVSGHVEHSTSSSSSNSGSAGGWGEFGTIDDGNGYFGSISSSGSGGKAIKKSVAGSIASAGSYSSSYGSASAHAGGYGHVFGSSFGGGGLFSNPHKIFGR